MPDEFSLRVISLGAGVQSSTLYHLAAMGLVGPMPQAAIFADTQQEPPWVEESLTDLASIHGHVIPIIRGTAGDLGDAVRKGENSQGGKFTTVPFWVRGENGRHIPGRRQCTREYKVDVVRFQIRTLLGLQPRQHAAGKFKVEDWVGISTNEAQRAKPSRTPWITTRWPLLYDIPMSRDDCIKWLQDQGLPVPKKSSCMFCPYRGADEYARWRLEDPELFEEACQWDEQIRHQGKGGQLQYISTLLIPLRDTPPLEELRPGVDEFGNECEGRCGG